MLTEDEIQDEVHKCNTQAERELNSEPTFFLSSSVPFLLPSLLSLLFLTSLFLLPSLLSHLLASLFLSFLSLSTLLPLLLSLSLLPSPPHTSLWYLIHLVYGECCLVITCFTVALALAGINTTASGDDPASTMAALLNKYVQIANLDKSCSARYHKRLRQRKEEKGEVSRHRETGRKRFRLKCVLY